MDKETIIRLLRQAGTEEERLAVVRAAITTGCPVTQLEELLDWLENTLSDLEQAESPPDEAAD